MLLHEAVKKARKDLGLSQDKLSELAGIQRRQLATLEAGGNVTLATLRKVLAQLPNLETFTLDAVTATVAEETVKAIGTAMDLMLGAVKNLVHALAEGKVPEERQVSGMLEANKVLYEGLGYTAEDAQRDIEEIRRARPEEPPEEPLTPERAAELYEALLKAARESGMEERLKEMGILPENGEAEQGEAEKTGG
jgi:predicted transcriptional regulator